MYKIINGEIYDKVVKMIEPPPVNLEITLFPLALFVLCLVFHRVAVNRQNKVLRNTLTAALVAAVCVFVFITSHQGSNFISYFMLAIIMCAATFILGFLPFKPLDYVIMFCAFLLIPRIYIVNWSNRAMWDLLMLGVFVAIAYTRMRSVKGHIFHIWLNFIIVAILSASVEFAFDRVVRQIGFRFNDFPIMKIAVWGLCSVVIVGISAIVIMLIKRLCFDYFNEINEMGKKYHAVEKYFIILSVGILVVCIVAQEFIFNRYDSAVAMIFRAAYFFGIAVQLLFLTLLFRLSHLRENLRTKEVENTSLLAYSSDLEQNFTQIQGIKHDIKNLFFAMGQYVERSNDAEFKSFYKEKIFPFAENEIQKNDLYAKLMAIDNEQLRAFMYYKLTQAFALGVAPLIEIQAGTSAFASNMRFSDLVRVLGILIDNALEESLLLEKNERELAISVTENAEAVSIKVRNKVRQTTLAEGIKPGISSKAGDRGRGLKIVNEIIAAYDFAALNSYFKDGGFVQNLMVYKQQE